MKIITGYLSGRKIDFIKSKSIRPTKNIVRKAIFDVLREWIVGKKVIELFAGTGILGIEAISNGAEKVIFVEVEKKCIDLIKKNLKQLNIEEKAEVKKGYVEDMIEQFKDIKYDLIIIDPPYDYSEEKIGKIINKVVKFNVINKNGIIVYEHRKDSKIFEINGIEIYKRKNYGKTEVIYLRRRKI